MRQGIIKAPLIPAAPIEEGAPPAPLLYHTAGAADWKVRGSSCCGVKQPVDRVGQRITEQDVAALAGMWHTSLQAWWAENAP
jgi:hypothetical protein